MGLIPQVLTLWLYEIADSCMLVWPFPTFMLQDQASKHQPYRDLGPPNRLSEQRTSATRESGLNPQWEPLITQPTQHQTRVSRVSCGGDSYLAMSQNPGTQMVPSNSWFMDSYPQKKNCDRSHLELLYKWTQWAQAANRHDFVAPQGPPQRCQKSEPPCSPMVRTYRSDEWRHNSSYWWGHHHPSKYSNVQQAQYPPW